MAELLQCEMQLLWLVSTWIFMFKCGSGGNGDSALTAGQPKRRCLLLRKDFLGPVHVAAQPRPPRLVLYELRPAKGNHR